MIQCKKGESAKIVAINRPPFEIHSTKNFKFEVKDAHLNKT